MIDNSNKLSFREQKDIINDVGSGEPLDFAVLSFDDKTVRDNYRKMENFALKMIADRECIFCFNKENENGMGGLGDLERIGYAHSPCIEAFYEVGFKGFRLLGYDDKIGDYRWEFKHG